MKTIASAADIAAAKVYEDLHVSAQFRQWTPLMVEAAEIHSGDRVLDVACGTGVLAREAVLSVGEGGYVAGLDPDPGRLAVAKSLAPSIDWRAGVAESLPFEDESFDAVVSQFGLMFFQNRPAALREMMRVLVPGGRIAVAVWDSLERSGAYPIEVALLERIAGEPAAAALRTPFVLGDQAILAALFRDTGADSVKIVTHCGTARFPGIRAMVESDLRRWLPMLGVVLSEDVIEAILSESAAVLGRFLTDEGIFEFDAPAHIVTGAKLSN
ncbi:MAG: methyltransferase domain-containing protein [Woeseiaceae bacterium]|nr:methyltransferase domain-containing protein [Woeseiaceae bacterium]